MLDFSARHRMLAAGIAVISAAVPVAGCGDDDEGDEAAQPRTVAIELTGSGKNLRFSVPKSVKGGVVRIRFTNSAKGEHGAQLGRVDAGHTPKEGLEAGGAWAERGRPLPPWVHLAGGVGTTPAGATSSATQELPAGQYFVVDVDSDASASFKVTGDGEAELPTPAARIDASEYTFDSAGLEAGRSQVLFDNKGREPHFAEGLRIKPGKTIADVRKFLREGEKGEQPILEEGRFSTAIADGGVRQAIELDLQPGKYALLCFVPDRKGGPPHVEKGMIAEAVVR
jgi:hypothetical protein